MPQNWPKVLAGAPVSDMHSYCFDRYIKALKGLSYSNYDICLVDNSKDDTFFNKVKQIEGIEAKRIEYCEKARERMVNARNLLRQKVLDEGYDYFFNLDQDVIPPKDVLERLIAHKKEIITGLYFNPIRMPDGKSVIVPVVRKKVKGTKVTFFSLEEVEAPRLIEVGNLGTGCILIHRNVLEKIKFRYDPNKTSFDDSWFAYDAQKLGFKLYCDTGVKCQHLVSERPWKWGNLLKEGTF